MKLTINKKIVSVSFLALALFMLIAVSYAYFVANIEGNDQANKTKVTTGTMSLKLDGTTIVGTDKMVPGEQHETTFTVENTGNVDALYNIDMIEVNNTYETKRDLVYKITSDNGGGQKSETILPSENGTLILNVYIKAGVTQTYTITVIFKDDRENQNENEGKSFAGRIQINNLEEKAIATTILRKNKLQTEEIDFSYGSPKSDGTYNGSGLYMTPDDDGVSYYYRGEVNNNNVRFANMDWKILRINGDGTIRIILSKPLNDRSVFNAEDNNIKYIGYTYDNDHACTNENPCISDYEENEFISNYGDKKTKDSTLKGTLENWYIDNLANFDDKIALTTYCNDTSILPYAIAYAKTRGSGVRVIKATPSLKCPNPTEYQSDVTFNYGGVYKLKIGLINGDESIMAGYGNYSLRDCGPGLYLTCQWNLERWTISPYNSIESSNEILASGIHYSNHVVTPVRNSVKSNYFIVPVINLKSDVVFTTNGTGEPGTESNPYTVAID